MADYKENTPSQKNIDKFNVEQNKAYDLVANTNCSFFLTGRAGTGKTTFLKRVQQELKKKMVVVAPTGVAALVAGGETIHSFFGFPTNDVITAKTKAQIKRRLHFLSLWIQSLLTRFQWCDATLWMALIAYCAK